MTGAHTRTPLESVQSLSSPSRPAPPRTIRAGRSTDPADGRLRPQRTRPVLFPTFRFALFFAAVLPASWLLMPHAKRWRIFMIGASFVFYGAWDWRYSFLLAASVLANQFFAVRIDRFDPEGIRSRWTAAAVVANL